MRKSCLWIVWMKSNDFMVHYIFWQIITKCLFEYYPYVSVNFDLFFSFFLNQPDARPNRSQKYLLLILLFLVYWNIDYFAQLTWFVTVTFPPEARIFTSSIWLDQCLVDLSLVPFHWHGNSLPQHFFFFLISLFEQKIDLLIYSGLLLKI